VVLCDALKLASEGRPELIIDYATLTGAARVALGPDVPPLFCNDDRLAEAVLNASVDSEDPLWRMPLFSGYEGYLDSTIADLSNCADNPMGGCITAALYLQRFVDEDIPWCHIDTYAWNRSDRPGRPAGGEAQGLRAMFHYLSDRFGAS
jgi:leucyl aminopeptidase